MKITYAVERLYETGWLPADEIELVKLPDGLRYPSVSAVLKLFKQADRKLTIKPHLMFGCYRAEWSGMLEDNEELSGTVVGSCEAEAAVYALAKLREQQAELRYASAESGDSLAAV